MKRYVWNGKLPENETELPEEWIEGNKHCPQCGEECLPWRSIYPGSSTMSTHDYVCPACSDFDDYFARHNLMEDYLVLHGCPTPPPIPKEEQVDRLRFLNKVAFFMDQKMPKWNWPILFHNLTLQREAIAYAKSKGCKVFRLFPMTRG